MVLARPVKTTPPPDPSASKNVHKVHFVFPEFDNYALARKKREFLPPGPKKK